MSLVLLVEDDPDVREDLAFLLEHRGHRTVTAANGKDAMDKLRDGALDGPPDLVILDLMMPVMDGWKMRELMLRDPDLAKIPVVLMSGAGDLSEQAETLKATDFLLKPVDLDKLYRLVDSHR